jgi:hypothetical protein
MWRAVVLVLAACGGGNDPEIGELSRESQQNLCQHFVDATCTRAPDTPACLDRCEKSACNAATSAGDVTASCSAHTVGEVDRCASDGDCDGGADCMLAALAAACNRVSWQ